MANILNLFNSIPLTDNILWQYDSSPNLKSLIESKQNWYNTNNDKFYSGLINNFLNLSTANDWGLTLWGIILQVPRIYTINGVETSLERERYRKILQAKLIQIKMTGTIPEINYLMNFLFGAYGTVKVTDNFDMTITYRFNFVLTDLQVAVLRDTNLLSTPAGVRANIISLDSNVFGFNGSNALPFNQGRFAHYVEFYRSK